MGFNEYFDNFSDEFFIKNQGWEFAPLPKIALFKERPWAICSRHSFVKRNESKYSHLWLKKRDVSDSLMIPSFTLKKGVIRSWFALSL